jgi:ABC-2 type transport system permease protein
VVGAGILIFDVPFRGSYLDLFHRSLHFSCRDPVAQDFISVIARTRLQAESISVISAFLPSFLLSGFIYPIENMPWPSRS